MRTVETKKTLSVAEFKKEQGTKALNIVKSQRTKKNYARNDKGDIVASVSDSIDLKGELEVRLMEDTETNETWYFLCNVTNYDEVGSI